MRSTVAPSAARSPATLVTSTLTASPSVLGVSISTQVLMPSRISCASILGRLAPRAAMRGLSVCAGNMVPQLCSEPDAVDPGRYKVTGGVDDQLFGWPLVEGDRNVKGYESICVPGSVDGLGLALERFGRKSLAEVMAPAIRMADEGLPVTWYTTLSIAVAAAELNQFASSRAAYLPDGLPPAPASDFSLRHLPRPALAATYRRLAEAGRRDFYEGALARDIVADLREGGSVISVADLAAYRAAVV